MDLNHHSSVDQNLSAVPGSKYTNNRTFRQDKDGNLHIQFRGASEETLTNEGVLSNYGAMVHDFRHQHHHEFPGFINGGGGTMHLSKSLSLKKLAWLWRRGSSSTTVRVRSTSSGCLHDEHGRHLSGDLLLLKLSI